MDQIHYSIEGIFLGRGDNETDVESESLWENHVGGDSMMKTLKMADICPLYQ